MSAAEDRPVHVLFAERVKAIRVSRRWSVRGLADAAGVSASTVSRIETGKLLASLDTAVALSGALGVPVGDMLARDGCTRCAGHPPDGFTCNACRADEASPVAVAEDRREALEDAVREALGRAYRYGLVAMVTAGSGGAPLGYPESAAEEARLLAAIDAYVKRDGDAP